MEDAIVAVFDTITDLTQSRNTGKARSYGFELNVHWQPVNILAIKADYSFTEFENLTDPGTYFTHSPRHNTTLSAVLTPIQKLRIGSTLHYMSERYSTTYGTIAQDFMTWNFQVSYAISRNFILELGIENILDRNYALAEGYPEPGRVFFGSLQFVL